MYKTFTHDCIPFSHDRMKHQNFLYVLESGFNLKSIYVDFGFIGFNYKVITFIQD